MKSKAKRAAELLRETADLLDTLPRRKMPWGQEYFQTLSLRNEADWREAQIKIWKQVRESVEDKSPIELAHKIINEP